MATTVLRMDHGRDEGFTLIELLVVVIIIGILAAIAIPSFLGQREHGFRAALQSDLRNVAIQAETFYTDNGTYDGFESDVLFTGFPRSGGVGLLLDAADTTTTSFCVEGSHSELPASEVWSYQNDRSPRLGDAAC